MIVLGALLAGLAAWLAVPRPLTHRLRASAPPSRGASPHRALVTAGACLVLAALVVTGAGALFGAAGAVVAVVAVLAAATGGRLVVIAVAERRSRVAQSAVAEACQVLAQLVAVGQTPGEALRLAALDCPVLAEAAALHRMGGDPTTAWRRGAEAAGHGGLLRLARAWQVGSATGASLVGPLRDAASAVRDDERLAATLRAELAAPRATGRMLAVLPVCGLALGQLLGSDPGEFLLQRDIGRVCLIAGAVLVCAGIVWVERLATVRTSS